MALPAWLKLRYVKAVAASLLLGTALVFTWLTRGVQSAVLTQRDWLLRAIAQRASMQVKDDFHSGLDLWDGPKNWARSWSFDAREGCVRTGQLALYRPSGNLADYRLEFFAQIQRKSVGWVFRAKDLRNYQAVKLSIVQPGPRPLVSVVRYPVIGGKKGAQVRTPLRMMLHNNVPWHVSLDVQGGRFRLCIEDQQVDAWSDDQLDRGGVGFFSEAGSAARLYWVKVSNHTDWLGRLCSILSENAEPIRSEAASEAPAPASVVSYRRSPL